MLPDGFVDLWLCSSCVLCCVLPACCAPCRLVVPALSCAVQDFNGRVKTIMKRCNNRSGACSERWALRFQLLVARAMAH
eukprot:13769670-Alexandrium_andersonii.AAC.1